MDTANNLYNFVGSNFPHFGETKRHEVARLFFEISKRENRPVEDILNDYRDKPGSFPRLKEYLVKRRFPQASRQYKDFEISLPAVQIQSEHKIKIGKRDIELKNIYIEQQVKDSPVIARLRSKFPQANFEIIENYKTHVPKKRFGIEDYNRRLDSFYFVKENFDFYKRCACSKGSVYCGYHIVNLGSGCAYECRYCYLQDYINSPGIILPANIDDFFKAFESYKQNIRIGSGEITDSLVFDHITEFSPKIVEFFRNHPRSSFEFKTKSNNVDLLFTVKPVENVVISWSINPAKVIDSIEHYTASLEERLVAAQKCAAAGYKVAFHFDPIIYYGNWEKDYFELVNQVFDKIEPNEIAWLSLGTLRMTPRLKKIIENRFPETTFLNEEFLLGHDDKLRYADNLRVEIYTKMMQWIRARASKVYLYLCMEEKKICQECQAPPLRNYQNTSIA